MSVFFEVVNDWFYNLGRTLLCCASLFYRSKIDVVYL